MREARKPRLRGSLRLSSMHVGLARVSGLAGRIGGAMWEMWGKRIRSGVAALKPVSRIGLCCSPRPNIVAKVRYLGAYSSPLLN